MKQIFKNYLDIFKKYSYNSYLTKNKEKYKF